MRLALAAHAVVAAALASGCGAMPPPDDTTDLRSSSVKIELGGADGANGSFATLVDGQDATLIEGAQGGFHVWMKYRVEGLAAGHYHSVRYAHRVSDDQIVLRIPPDGVDVGAPGAEGYWESPSALPMFMCPSPIGIRVVDETIRYEIDLVDDAGKNIAGANVTLVPRCPATPTDTYNFCERICTG